MDLHSVGRTASASMIASRAAKSSAMPENKGVGWRKKIHSKPKETLSPRKELKELPSHKQKTVALKTEFASAQTSEGDMPAPGHTHDRRGHHSWRKTIQGSRPGTPVVAAPKPLVVEDFAEARSERSETPAPHRNSKPKLARYTSLFNGLIDAPKDAPKRAPKGLDFPEPWSEDAPVHEPYMNPLLAIQAVASHMTTNSAKPIPPEHCNGLFRIFEDYRRLRESNEHLKVNLLEIEGEWERAEGQWLQEERRFNAEIRRLELLIADGATGVAGVLNARQGSVVERRPRHRSLTSNAITSPMDRYMTQEQLDKEIKLRTQGVLLRRPTSPSEKMAVLSRQFTGRASADLLRVGSVLSEDAKTTLSRKVQSEVNLTKLARLDTVQSITTSVTSGFSGSGDALPDEILNPSQTFIEVAVDCDALVALRELAILVARRRGLRADRFVDGLMKLLSTADDRATGSNDDELSSSQARSVGEDNMARKAPTDEAVSATGTIRGYQPQPQLSSKHRRHFSFDPGDDHLQASQEQQTPVAVNRRLDALPESDSSQSAMFRDANAGSPLRGLKSSSQLSISSIDSIKRSKIPTPALPLGRVRRENSASSLQSVLTIPNNERRDSRTSIMTVVRNSSTSDFQSNTSSRSSSFHNLRSAEALSPQKDQSSSTRVNNMSLASSAARTASQASMLRTGSPVSSAFRVLHNADSVQSENVDPCQRNGATSE